MSNEFNIVAGYVLSKRRDAHKSWKTDDDSVSDLLSNARHASNLIEDYLARFNVPNNAIESVGLHMGRWMYEMPFYTDTLFKQELGEFVWNLKAESKESLAA
jgi:hypothetical protein